jgi:hypothetical protein
VQFGGSANDLAMMVHLEKFPAGGAAVFHASLGVAKSTDGGSSWTQLGQCLSLSYAYNAAETTNQQDVGSGSIVVVGSYYYCYFREYTGATIADSHQSVARCLVSSFNSAVSGGTVPTFDKWQGGTTWGGSNLGANLTTFDNRFFHPDIWKDSDLNLYLSAGNYAPSYPSAGDIYPAMQFSYDGLTWYGLTILATNAEGASYDSIIPTTITSARAGTGPWTLIYVAGTRWSDCTVQSRTVTLGSIGEPHARRRSGWR